MLESAPSVDGEEDGQQLDQQLLSHREQLMMSILADEDDLFRTHRIQAGLMRGLLSICGPDFLLDAAFWCRTPRILVTALFEDFSTSTEVTPKELYSTSPELHTEVLHVALAQIEDTLELTREEMTLLAEADQPGSFIDSYVQKLAAVLQTKADGALPARCMSGCVSCATAEGITQALVVPCRCGNASGQAAGFSAEAGAGG